MTKDDIRRGGNAIANAGSRDYSHHAGATMELIADHAKAGKLDAMSTTLTVHCAIHRQDRRALLRIIPPVIRESYLHKHRGLEMSAIDQWCERNPDWAGCLVRIVENPARFERVAGIIAHEIAH